MFKNFSKLLLTLLIIILTVSSLSFCLATNTTTEETSEAVSTSETTTSDTDNIHYGDLYVFDTNVTIDKIVYGNVYIVASNTVEITGQIEGNLFVIANTLKLDSSVNNGGLVGGSIFVCANTVYYNGACTYLYSISNKLELTYDSYIVRDLKALASDVTFKSAIGRDVDLYCNTVDFGEAENSAIIYGNLRYSAPTEATIPEGVMTNENNVTYTKISQTTKNAYENIINILVKFISCIITVLVIYVFTKKFTPKFAEKLSNEQLSVLKILRSFGIGFLTLILFVTLFVALLMTVIGSKLAFILAVLFATICLISVPALTIIITSALKPTFKIEKTSMFCLILVLVSIVLYGVTLIPFVGGLLSFIIFFTSLGMLIDMFIPYKELSDEEKLAIEEAKKQAIADKEKRKQEKLKAREAKKKENKE